MSAINQFLISNHIYPVDNPAISPDLCLDPQPIIEELKKIDTEDLDNSLNESGFKTSSKARVQINEHTWQMVIYAKTGESFWLSPDNNLEKFENTNIAVVGNLNFIPHTWNNLIAFRNVADSCDPSQTIFPIAEGDLKSYSLGIGARMTTLHWPAVAWVMRKTGISLTANQNSIPRELVYDVDAMLDDRLTEIDFPFIGSTVPEGHQGQSVQGMSHASVMTYLWLGLHHHRIPWGFNADHQPIGGRFDAIEDELVEGSLFASYITFDLSPELMQTEFDVDEKQIEENYEQLPHKIREGVRFRLDELDVHVNLMEQKKLMGYIYPAMEKMIKRYEKYREVRTRSFEQERSQKFFSELSIDELPGLTTTETLAICLAISEQFGVNFDYVAPNIGFQKNTPFADQALLRERVSELFEIAKKFGVSFGFHSGSGKSRENYEVLGEITDSNLEIKTSGRYTYEFGAALSKSNNPEDKKLWQDWYGFCKNLAVDGVFSDNVNQSRMAREFITETFKHEQVDAGNALDSRESLMEALDKLTPSPDHMHWFEYNFLYILYSGKMGDHSPEGYRQRARFYSVSEEARLLYCKNIANYIIFLAETTGKLEGEKAQSLLTELEGVNNYQDFVDAI